MAIVNPILESLMNKQWTALQGIALGYEIQEHVATKLFPIIETSSPRPFVPKFGKEHLQIAVAERAMDTEAVTVVPATIGEEFMTLSEYALKTPLDHRRFEAVSASQVAYDIIKHESYKLLSQIMNQSENDLAVMLQTVGTYPAGHVATPTGNDAWTDVDSNPFKQIEAGIEKIKSKGHTPNFVFFGRTAWNQFKENAKVITAIHGNTGETIVTEEQVKAKFGSKIAELIIANGSYAKADGTFADYYDDVCIIGRKSTAPADKRDMYTTAAGYQLRGQGMAAGPKVSTWWTDNSKTLFNIHVQMRLTNVLLAADALYLIKNTDAS